MEKKLEFNYWKIKFQSEKDDTMYYSYERTGVWQTMPYNAVSITEEEYQIAISKTTYED